MRALLAIAARSAWHRRGTLVLVGLSIALSTLLLLTLLLLLQKLLQLLKLSNLVRVYR